MMHPWGFHKPRPTWVEVWIILSALCCGCLPLAVRAQTTEAGAQSGSAPVQTVPVPTIHATSQLVLVDVVVTHASGEPVKGLSKDAFRVIESGKPQTLRGFEEHISSHEALASAGSPKLQPGVFTNVLVKAADAPLNVLLLDKLNTPTMDQSFVRNQLLKYLKDSQPGARAAIFCLTDKLVMLQGFTSDPEMLRRAVEHSGPQASALLSEKTGGKSSVEAEGVAGIEAQLSVSPEMADAVREFNNADKETNENLMADATLSGLHQLALYLGGIPGRKNLIWFSASFPLTILPRGRIGSDPFAGSAAWAAEYRETVNLLAQSQVAVYPIDARGLMPLPMPGASYSVTGRDQRNFSYNLAETQSTMFEMAEDTGGKAYVNTNGLAQAVEKIVENGSNYYTLAYTPSAPNPHGEYRSIRVDVAGSKYTLAYRRGYYADANMPPAGQNARDTVRAASLFIAPPATQILFFARVLPLPPNAEDIISPGDVPRQRAPLQVEPTDRFSVEYSTALSALSIAATADGLHHAHIEYIALVYDAEGRVVHSDVKPVRVTWNAAQFERARQWGVRYQQQIRVPADRSQPGEYSLRLVVHDLSTDRIGSLDIPPAALKAETPDAKAGASPPSSSPSH